MNIRQIEVFRKVMELGTTTAAANALNISQPAVSNTIRQMESQIGFDLFKRDNGRLRPTAEAQAVNKESEHMFLLFGLVQRKISDLKNGTVGSIRVVAPANLGNTIIPAVIRSFLEMRSDV